MKAHIIENNKIVNTIEVDTLNVFPNLIDASIGGTIGWDVVNSIPVAPTIIITIPQEVTRRQAKLALNQMGLLVTVETTITNSTDTALKIDWAEASTFRRDWASLIAMATSLGMTSVQLDDLFILGATL